MIYAGKLMCVFPIHVVAMQFVLEVLMIIAACATKDSLRIAPLMKRIMCYAITSRMLVIWTVLREQNHLSLNSNAPLTFRRALSIVTAL